MSLTGTFFAATRFPSPSRLPVRALYLIALATLSGLAVRAWPPAHTDSAPAPAASSATDSRFATTGLALKISTIDPAVAAAVDADPEAADEAQLCRKPVVPHAERSATRVWLPKDSVLVVGSLDRAGGLHQVIVNAGRKLPTTSDQPGAVPVRYIRTPLCPAEFATRFRPTVQSRFRAAGLTGRPAVTAFATKSVEISGTIASHDLDFPTSVLSQMGRDRRFCVPFFTPTGVVDHYPALTPVAQNGRVTIYADAGQLRDRLAATKIAERLNAGLVERVEQRVAPILDIDGDERLSVVVCRLSEHFDAGGQPLLGCVRPSDFYGGTSFFGDIVYLDPRLADQPGIDALLVHELTHAAVFCFAAADECPAWLNEAVAHLVEWSVDPHSPNLVPRIHAYRDRPQRYPVLWHETHSARALRRGPARVAGFTFLQSMLHESDQTTLPALFSQIVTLTRSSLNHRFAAAFRRWSTQLATQVRQRDVVRDDPILLRGTAFCAFDAGSQARWVTISAAIKADLQISVLTCDATVLMQKCEQKVVSMAGNRPKAGRTVVEIRSE